MVENASFNEQPSTAIEGETYTFSIRKDDKIVHLVGTAVAVLSSTEAKAQGYCKQGSKRSGKFLLLEVDGYAQIFRRWRSQVRRQEKTHD